MRTAVDRGIRLLLAANIGLVVVLLAVVVVSNLGSTPGTPAQLEPTPSPSQDTIPMGLAHIPTSNSCLLCHERGGAAELKPIPAIGHELEGWTSCLTCHDDASLGRKAPGHLGIAESECLSCHKVAPDGPSITQAHADLHEACLDCHGDVAHLPSSMVGRNQDECWLCHKPNPAPPPAKPHPDPQNLTCRSCHQSRNGRAGRPNKTGSASCKCCLQVPDL